MTNNLVGGIIPPQPPIQPQTDAHALKSRLEWGEPAFTLLDVRDRMTYNEGHIMGAMPMPLDQLVDRASSSLDKNRDIYVYGASEEETSQAAQALRSAGFVHVSELKGGLPAWKAIGGPTEGIVESQTPAGADDYNVVDRMKNHLENQPKTGASPKKDIAEAKNRAGEFASQVKENLKDTGENVKENLQDAQASAKENLQKTADNVTQSTQDSHENQQQG